MLPLTPGIHLTIASLVVQLSASVDKLKAGLDQGVSYTKSFANRQQRILDNAGTTSKLQADLVRLQAAYDAAAAHAASFARTASGAYRDVASGKFAKASDFASASSDAGAAARQLNAVRDHIAALGKDTEQQERLSAALQRSIAVQAADNAERQKSVDLLQRQITAAKLEEFGASASSLGRKLSTYVTAPLLAAATAAANFGAQADLAATRMNIVFGGAAFQVNQRIAELRKTIPATTAELQRFTASLAEEYLALGLGPEKARTMSTELLRVAGALAQFKGRSVEDALNAIRGATNGMTRPLRDFGVLLDQGSIKLEAQRLGLSKHGEQLTQLGRIQAAYSLILERSQIQQHAAAELAGTAANRIKFTTANLREARDVIGQQLLPVMVPLAEVISNIADKLAHLNPETIKTGLYFAAVVAAGGPLLSIIGGLSSAISVLITRVALLEGESALGGLAVLLTPGGLILGGLALLAVAFYAVEQAANTADSATLRYRQSLSGLTAEQIDHQITVNRLALAQASASAKEDLNSKLGTFQLGLEIAHPALATFLPDVSGIDASGKKVKDLTDTLGVLYDMRRKLTALPTVPIVPDIRTSIAKGDGGAAKEAAAGVSLLVERIQKARETLVSTISDGGATTGAESAYGAAIGAALDNQTKLTAQIAAAKGHTTEVLRLTKEYDSITKALTVTLPKVALPTIKSPDFFPAIDVKNITAGAVKDLADTGILAPVRAAADQVAAIQARFELTNRIRTAGGQKPLDADAVLKPYLDKALEYANIANRAIFGSDLTDAEKRGQYDELLKLLDRAGIKAKALKQPFDGVVTSIHAAVGALHSLADLATAAGNSSLGNILNTSANLGQNIGSAFEAKTTSQKITADLGIASSILALGQTLLNDPTKAERNAVTKANTLALQQVSLKLSGFVTNASNTVAASSALSALFTNQGALAAVARNQTHSGGFLGKQEQGDLQSQLDALNPILKSAGLSFAQLESITKTYGLELRDKSGRIVVDALSQLRTGLLDAAKAAFSFGSSFADQNTLAELRDKIAGKTTPADDLKRQVALIQSLAPSLLPGTYDTTSATGQTAIRANLASLVEGIANKTIDPSAFGGFSNLSELTGVVGSVIDALNGMQSSVAGVTQSLVNVAPYFKVDAARYNATLPSTLTSASGFGGGLSPLSPSVVPSVTATVTQTFGDIVVSGTNKDPKQIAVEVRSQLQSMALSRFGTTTRWAETQ